jgi:hypothetical protein
MGVAQRGVPAGKAGLFIVQFSQQAIQRADRSTGNGMHQSSGAGEIR